MNHEENNFDQINHLVLHFYEKVRKDDLLGPVFNTHVKDWESHISTIQGFFRNILLNTGEYQGNPIQIHKNVHLQYPLTLAHFDRWIELFHAQCEHSLSDPILHLAKQRAESIATVLKLKLLYPQS